MSDRQPAALALAAPSAADWREVFGLLDAALDLDVTERTDWLASLGPAQQRLAPWLRELLQEQAGLDAARFMGETATSALEGPSRPTPGADEVIGPYRLLHEIGEGGMATVWLAERADGLLERRVALKLPHVSWGRGSFAERMARERNILASLTHPNIARLYDAGLAADGRPYLALEFIDGQPIDVHAATHGLNLKARIGLIVQVARAVAYAHAQLVVHRDLKPSNILVDAQGRAHLLDFGVAKLIDPGDGSGAADATQVGGRALTPHYASPEQIRGDPIGTASDIYSLGIVAFELLTGKRPYQLPKNIGPVALAEAVARVEMPLASRIAGAEPLRNALRGDLDAILTRALAKAASDRYPTVDALADDFERHLRGEPVRARAASRGYLAERWLRRHPWETGIATALVLGAAAGAYAQVLVVLAVGAGALVSLWQRNQALKQAALARAALERGEQVKGFIASIFTQAVPRAGRGGAVVATDLLKAAARRIETDLATQPAVAAELGALVGASFNELGDVRAGLDWLPRAVELCTRELGPSHPLTLQSRRRLVEAANSVGELTVSEPLLPALVRDLRAAPPSQAALLVGALQSQAYVHTKRGREPEAMAALLEAVEVATARFGESSEIALTARASLSNTCAHFGRHAAALAASVPALAPAHAAFGHLRPHPTLTAVERCHADALALSGRPRDATPLLRRVLADQSRLDVDETHRVRVITSLLARALMLSGRLDEAADLFAQAAATHERLTGGINHEGVGAHTYCGRAAVMQGDGAAALAHLERASEIAGRLGDEGVAMARQRAALHAWALALAGRGGEALARLDDLGATPPTGLAALRWGVAQSIAFQQTGDVAAAVGSARWALEAAVGEDCPALEQGLACVEAARCDLAAGQPDSAAAHWHRAAVVWKAGQVDGMQERPAVLAGIAALQRSA